MARLLRLNGFAAAIAAPCLALVLLAGCGGDSGAAADVSATASSDGTRDAAALSVAASGSNTANLAHLFIPDIAHRGVVALSTLEPDVGEVLPAPTLKATGALGANVQVDAARDELYAIVGQVVEVYAGASTLKSDATPARSFSLPATLTAPHALWLDVARDELYVGGDTAHGNGEIVTYPFAHTLRGTPATPSRALFVDHGVSFFTIDAVRERLFVVNADAGVHVFADVSSASGQLVAATTIPVLGSGLAVDTAHDRLYVADLFAGLILVDQASAPSPVVTATMSIDDARFVSVDAAADRVYLSAGGSLYTFDHASALTSTASVGLPATARLAGTTFGAVATR